jgi:MFS family permease
MIFIGSLLGFFVVPYFADNWGRRIAIRVSWAICTVGVACITFAVSPSMIGIGYFLAGFGANPAITLCYSFINE